MWRFLFVGSVICLMLFAIAGCGKNEASSPGSSPAPAVKRTNSGSGDQEMAAPPPTTTPAAAPSAAPAEVPIATPPNTTVQGEKVDPKSFEATQSNPAPLKGRGLDLSAPQ